MGTFTSGSVDVNRPTGWSRKRLVEWDAFMPDALVLASRGVAPIDIHASAAAMQRLVDESECALARRQDAMLKWLPLLSWNYDPHMTSMHVLAQTALQIKTHGWSDGIGT